MRQSGEVGPRDDWGVIIFDDDDRRVAAFRSWEAKLKYEDGTLAECRRLHAPPTGWQTFARDLQGFIRVLGAAASLGVVVWLVYWIVRIAIVLIVGSV